MILKPKVSATHGVCIGCCVQVLGLWSVIWANGLPSKKHRHSRKDAITPNIALSVAESLSSTPLSLHESKAIGWSISNSTPPMAGRPSQASVTTSKRFSKLGTTRRTSAVLRSREMRDRYMLSGLPLSSA
jgi:hypothetical protein